MTRIASTAITQTAAERVPDVSRYATVCACVCPVYNSGVRSGLPPVREVCDTAYIEKEKRNLILLQCCDKLLFPVVISESIRMDVVEGKGKRGVLIVASGTALGMVSVVVVALPSTVVMVVVPAVRDAAVVETGTVVGRSEKQEQ